MKKYTIQEIEAALDIVREAIPGITIPKINYGTAIGGAAPEAGATNGATWGTNLSAIPDIVAALVTGILGAWNVTNFNLRSGSSDDDSAVLLDPTNSQIRLGATTGDYITLDGILKQIISSNYAAGVSGFKISPDLIEAENINARGTLRGATFVNNIISAIGGQLMVANASSLAEDMTVADNSTLTIKDDTTFEVNDILVMRAVASSGVQEEWLRVTDASSAPTYSVTRDLAGLFSSGANPAWKAGTPVVKQGSSNGTDTYSGGWLRLIGEGTNSPYYSVYQRNGVAYNAYAEVCRLGNLNGFLGITTDKYGIAMGTTDKYFIWDGENFDITDIAINNIMTAGEAITVTTPVPIFINKTDYKVYKTDANDNSKLDFIGFALETGDADDDIKVQMFGVVGGFSSLSPGARYYVQDDGSIGLTPGTYPIQVGISTSETEVFIKFSDATYITPSDTVIDSAGAFGIYNADNSLDNPTKVAEFLYQETNGTLRTKIWSNYYGGGGGGVNSRIYKNGVAYGTSRNVNSAGGAETIFTEDLSFVTGDLIQLYVWCGYNGPSGYAGYSIGYQKTLLPKPSVRMI